MVLEEATSSQEPSFTEDAPNSDIDPYAACNPPYSSTREPSYVRIPQPGTEPIYVNLNALPRPFSPFSFNSQHANITARGILESCKLGNNILQRPLRQEEADAFAWHFAKSIRVATYGAPAGAAIAAVRFWRTTSTFRFPFFSPMKEGGKYSPDRYGPLQGQQARLAWHMTRGGAYFLVGVVLGQVAFGMYALSSRAAGQQFDPRLKDFREAVTQRQRDGTLRTGINRDQGEGAKRGETFEMARQRRTVERKQPQKAQVDDMSPTGGAFQQEGTDGQTDTGMMSDSQVQQYNSQVQEDQETDTYTTVNTSKASSPQAQPSSTSSTFSESESRPNQPQGSGRYSGGAWDKLRKTAMSSENQSQSTRSQRSRSSETDNSARNSSGGGDGFSFSQGHEDRQLAKAEAQKDFDNRMEQEREGRE
ncbi:hypothetical protein LTR37_007490 [Vermiconidia calcicola]|uniref:Uncharacterized protein n=1 Tax=Vermiconidia calcicola TaxID=1690605 RepID=A0ACC3NDV6_9PEZI|nr:hypothetical protein LTR37_007490 [Vermiconidia calcicola]